MEDYHETNPNHINDHYHEFV